MQREIDREGVSEQLAERLILTEDAVRYLEVYADPESEERTRSDWIEAGGRRLRRQRHRPDAGTLVSIRLAFEENHESDRSVLENWDGSFPYPPRPLRGESRIIGLLRGLPADFSGYLLNSYRENGYLTVDVLWEAYRETVMDPEFQRLHETLERLYSRMPNNSWFDLGASERSSDIGDNSIGYGDYRRISLLSELGNLINRSLGYPFTVFDSSR